MASSARRPRCSIGMRQARNSPGDSPPILAGGMVRWLVDRHLRKKLAHRNLTEEELTAEGDKSPGVLLASGYIAGGAIAGIVIAFLTELAVGFDDRVTAFMASNPFFEGPWADTLSMVPFAVLSLLLYLAGREKILVDRKP